MNDMVKGGIASRNLPGGSSNLQLHVLAGGSTHLPFSWGQGPHLTQCVIEPTSVPARWYRNPSNSLSRGHECDLPTPEGWKAELT